jgi:hypothetical protein
MPRFRFSLRWAWVALVLLGAALFAHSAWSSLHRDPFRMTLKPSDGGTVIQFLQPDRGLSSPEFHVDGKVDAPQSVDLRSGDISIPIGKVEFSDTTMYPGRFRIRFGDQEFDVMEPGIEVGSKAHPWLHVAPDQPGAK